MKNHSEPDKENQVLTSKEPLAITKSGGVTHLTIIQYFLKTIRHHTQSDVYNTKGWLEPIPGGVRLICEIRKAEVKE